jgi:hypothetical protein
MKEETMYKANKSALLLGLLAGLLAATPASSQTAGLSQPATETTTTGVVASSTASTLVLKTGNGQFLLFVYGENVVKPATIPPGSTVNIIGTPRPDGVIVANYITVTSTQTAATSGAPAAPKTGASASSSDTAIPASVRDLERGIVRQSKRFQAGIQAGVGLDPEVVLVGVTSKMGPIFSKDLTFRPNADFIFGEVTKGVQINLDMAYRLPLSPRNSAWSAYLGAGPNLSFLGRNFERAMGGDNSIDFSDFDFKAGLNVLGGVEYRSGMFFELKAGVYTEPTLRIMFGYRF